jgi:hypothetical protein
MKKDKQKIKKEVRKADFKTTVKNLINTPRQKHKPIKPSGKTQNKPK